MAAKKKILLNTKVTEPAKDKRLEAFVAGINASLRKSSSPGRIDLGSAIQFLDPPRLSTGSLGLDIITGGGIPRGHKTEMWGPFSCGKTTTAMHVVSHNQHASKARVLWAAAEAFSKQWGRKNGMLIPFTDDELARMAKTKPKTAKRLEKEQRDWPQIVVATHTHGDALLEIVYEAVRDNVFDLIVVDSLGAIVRYDDIEERSVEDMKYGGQSTLFGAFCNKANSGFNRKYDPLTGEVIRKAVGERWAPNTTAMICINQARQKIGWSPSGRTQYKPVGGEALRHFWDLSIEYSHGPRFSEKDTKNERKAQYAQEIRAFVEKSKVGPPHMETEWQLYTRDYGDFKGGDVDTAAEVFSWADHFGLIERAGANYYIGGQRYLGKEPLVALLRDNDEIRTDLYAKAVEEAKRRFT